MLEALRMIIKEQYCVFIVVAFSCGRAKTIQIRFVHVRGVFFVKTELKISVFKNIPVRVSEALDRTSICGKVCFKTNE